MFFIDSMRGSKPIVFTIKHSETGQTMEVKGYNNLKKFRDTLMHYKGENLYGCWGNACTVYDFKKGFAEYNALLSQYSVTYTKLLMLDSNIYERAVLVRKDIHSYYIYGLPFTRASYGCRYDRVEFAVQARDSSHIILFSFTANETPISTYGYGDLDVDFYIYKGELCFGAPYKSVKNSSKVYVKLVNPLTLEKIGKAELDKSFVDIMK